VKKVLYILGQLDDADVDWLGNHGERQKFPKGHKLITAGVKSDYLYVVLDGSLAVVLTNGFRLAVVGCGEILGEISLVDSRPPSASVVVDEPCLLLAVNQAKLREKMRVDTGFAARFYRALAIFLSNRMRSTMTTLGYGKADQLPESREESDPDLLDDEVLDGVYNAGMRFERMLKKLAQ
jgi:CRP/FNR family cyclic AMP-dependent transcriptional regulator